MNEINKRTPHFSDTPNLSICNCFRTKHLSKVLEQVDVEDAPGDSADPLDTGVNLIRLV